MTTRQPWTPAGDHRLDIPTLAYVASVIDTQAVIRVRVLDNASELPFIAISSPNIELLELLAELTGTKVTAVRRDFTRAGCAQHCKEKHQHVVSKTGRWSLTGVKATVLLYNVRPYLRFQQEAAARAMAVGQAARFHNAVLGKMATLGWELPDLGDRGLRAV